ncbi:MAG: DUF1499 domain-containing protein [Gammaproteobacteria bacterium]|jgi:hypothetical protein|nr:DUF1499 domain-containing protein [Gammaproteobacteria bacterium]MBP6229594.1 DUF1499 domain-containing protein [Pseudomonadales bacterium]MBK6585101.1 DUF1499 domain-containing protein [Gammaproteobacteria bacterium]MBK7168748.1 DUF1499 domain-containing protein [Gammaproteobacteria bacterium]MBK7520185.1 DUF1499 domain-containing protein [Gammaproteobacteria bacterium]
MSSAKPAPRAITGCRNLGILFLLLLFAAPLATRCGLISYPLGLPLTALAVLGAALVLIMVLLMLPRVRYRAHRSRLGMIALIAALPVIAGVVVMAPGAGLPVIHDLSTDISDPPVFEAVLALRGPDTNPLARDADTDAAQRAGYPELRTIESVLAPAAAFAKALATARSLGWEIHATDAQRGLLEASETTFWFGFIDDIAIRVRPYNDGSRIDLRSVSRVGRGDLGANAKRIRRFSAAFAASGNPPTP